MSIYKPSFLTAALMLLPLLLLETVDLALTVFPGVDPMGFYIAILLASGMMYGMFLERYLLGPARLGNAESYPV
jgi:hypothetical protein